VIVSVDAFHQNGPRVVVVPRPSRQHPDDPFTYRYRERQVTAYVCCDHVRTVDVSERLAYRMAPQPVPARVLG
jgi:hypothetical protein